VQLEPAASEAPQVVELKEKGAVTVATESDALVLPVFERVTVCTGLVEPTV
jgi:hypothetical protein